MTDSVVPGLAKTVGDAALDDTADELCKPVGAEAVELVPGALVVRAVAVEVAAELVALGATITRVSVVV